MQQPDHDIRIAASPQATPRRLISLGLVGLLHVILVYALVSGLAQDLVKKGLDEIKVATVEDKPDVKPPPPPPPKLEEPPPPFVPPPDIVIEQTVAPTNTITTQDKQPVQPPPQPKAAVSTPVSIGRAHTCSQNYPSLSQRLQEEGTATLAFTINVDGSVSGPSIAKSSGFQRLDDASLTCVTKWRYKPATQEGQPVAAQWQAAVQWKLH